MTSFNPERSEQASNKAVSFGDTQKDKGNKKVPKNTLGNIATSSFKGKENEPPSSLKLTKKVEPSDKMDTTKVKKIVKKDQIEKDKLNISIEQFKERTKNEVLAPKRGVSDTDSDVFFYDQDEGTSLVIKPGERDARASLMAQEVLKIVELNHTVPAMKMNRLQHVKSSLDIDKEYVIKKDSQGKEFAIESETLIPLSSNKLPKEGERIKDPHSDSFFVVKYVQSKDKRAKDLTLVLAKEPVKTSAEPPHDDELFFGFHFESSSVDMTHIEPASDEDLDIEESESEEDVELGSDEEVDIQEPESEDESWIFEFQNTPFKLIQNPAGTHFYLAPETAMCPVIDKNARKYVLRNEFPYSLSGKKDKEGVFDIVGSKVPALYQEKIMDRHVGTGEEGLDITKPSKERDAFYAKIDRDSFMDSFISFMLTRSHDGKIEKLLNDSNFLFKEMENGHLSIRQIDLDDVMPTSNTPANNNVPHPLRCGLMGFPMVDEEISGQRLQRLKGILARCVTEENQQAALKTIEMWGKKTGDTQGISESTRQRMKAYKEVIEGIKTFLEQDIEKVTLKELFYSVFPSYKEHFELLVNPPGGKEGISPELAALQVGAEPLAIYLDRDRSRT